VAHKETQHTQFINATPHWPPGWPGFLKKWINITQQQYEKWKKKKALG